MKRRIKQLLERKGFDTKYVAKLDSNKLEDKVANLGLPNSEVGLILFPGRSIVFDSQLSYSTPYSAMHLNISQGCDLNGIIEPRSLKLETFLEYCYSARDKIISWNDDERISANNTDFDYKGWQVLQIRVYRDNQFLRRISIAHENDGLYLKQTFTALSAPRRLLPADFGKNKPQPDPPGPLSDYSKCVK